MTATEPRTVTLDQINAEIASEHYFTAADGVAGAFTNAQIAQGRGVFPDEIGRLKTELRLLTFCVLILKNGFTVTGQSACADPAKFNAEMGRKLAREDAIRQRWKLLGFRLRDQIAAEQGTAPAAKRYTAADFADLKWATGHFDVLRADKVDVFARMQDGKEFRASFELGRERSVHEHRRMAAHAVLAVANGEAS